MNLTRAMREKYRLRPYKYEPEQYHYPAGGEDIVRLCELADDLLDIVRWAQCNLPADQQQEVERKLWLAEKGR